ncbi:MAG TPA: ATP-binding protein, partial [Actinocrinis sp.]|nr:ATP-binding protein [Actinocrinis sp.]
LSRKISVEALGEILELKNTVNAMVDQLSGVAGEVTRVAREVGTEGNLGGQATVRGVSGTWKDLTDAVNQMAANLTAQVRDIAQVATAVARGDLTRKITVDTSGEVETLAVTVNEMVDTLSAFAAEVTRVAREVGTEGNLGGQAEVEGVAGTWKKLTDSVNRLAGNLTTQVRAIAGVATAVTEGDLTRRITVDASGEVAELKDDINRMIVALGETTRANEERTWLGRQLARISGLLQGHRNLTAMAQLVMNELTPLVGAQQGAFFLAETGDGPVLAGEPVPDADIRLRMIAGYAFPHDPASAPVYALGQSLVGQVAAVRRTIEVDGAPDDYMRVSSGTGWSGRVSVIVLPVQYEGQILGVIELAAAGGFTPVRRELLDQLKETIGVAVNTITTSARTDELLRESQRLTAELRFRQEDLQASNAQLGEKAEQLERQNTDIELKTVQIEQARLALQDRAQQLALASKVKSEFMANMSHELRTPLGSLLILAELLAQNSEQNLTPRQVDFARTIYSAGSDLLQLINDILDLSKVEAGRMEVRSERLPLAKLVDYVEATFQPLAADKGLELTVTVAAGAPESMVTDEQRIQQILRNLLSNAVKFTDHGRVALEVAPDPELPGVLEFAVSDTGIGIAEDKLRVIFEAFQQADGTTSRQFGGTGLGLSISRELTQLLGGDLRVRSSSGRGSTFTLRLPVEPAAPADQSADAPADAPEAAGFRPAPPAVVLVVEPEAAGALYQAAHAAVQGLAGVKEPVEVVAARGVGQITETLGGREAAVVLLDLAASDDEIEAVVGSLAEATADIPVLALEARPGGGAAEQLRASSAGRCRIEPVRSVAQATERLTLHLLTALPRAADLLLSGREPRRTPVRFRGEKVLMVDDDVRTVFALTSALELHGLTVLHADNGLRGIEMLTRNPDVGLVLMDLMMPGMDGYATTERIRGMPQFADLPIIAVTAKAMKGDREKSMAAGTNEHVTKPVDVAGLLELIRGMLRGRAPQPLNHRGNGAK